MRVWIWHTCAFWQEESVTGSCAVNLSRPCPIPLLSSEGLPALWPFSSPNGIPFHLLLWNPGLPTSDQLPVSTVELGNQTRILAEHWLRKGQLASSSQLYSQLNIQVPLYLRSWRWGAGVTLLKWRTFPRNGSQHPSVPKEASSLLPFLSKAPDIWSRIGAGVIRDFY